MQIQLDKVTKTYGPVKALTDVTANVEGELIGLLGPNGSGKSTLLKCMLGLTPHKGAAHLFGLSSATESFAIRDRVGYMPELDSFLAGMTAVELCAYAGELSGLPKSEAMQRAHSALYYAGLEDKRYLKVEGYSTGLMQRVKLAQALVHDPDLLFLDEPTNGLDPRARDEMLELVMDLPKKRGCTVIISTHLLFDVDRICDHALILQRGRVRFSGTIEDLRGQSISVDTFDVEVKAEMDKLAVALEAAGCEVDTSPPLRLAAKVPDADPVTVFRIARDAGVQVRHIEVKRDSLEQAFLRVVGADSAFDAGPDNGDDQSVEEAAP